MSDRPAESTHAIQPTALRLFRISRMSGEDRQVAAEIEAPSVAVARAGAIKMAQESGEALAMRTAVQADRFVISFKDGDKLTVEEIA